MRVPITADQLDEDNVKMGIYEAFWEKGQFETHTHCSKGYNTHSCYGKQFGTFLKVKQGDKIWHRGSTSRYILKEQETTNSGKICPWIVKVLLYLPVKEWK